MVKVKCLRWREVHWEICVQRSRVDLFCFSLLSQRCIILFIITSCELNEMYVQFSFVREDCTANCMLTLETPIRLICLLFFCAIRILSACNPLILLCNSFPVFCGSVRTHPFLICNTITLGVDFYSNERPGWVLCALRNCNEVDTEKMHRVDHFILEKCILHQKTSSIQFWSPCIESP